MSFFKVKDENGNWVPPEAEEMIDQFYSPESENAQSGFAVAEAVATKMDKFGEVIKSDWGVSLDNGSKNLEIKTNPTATMVVTGGKLILRDDGGGTIFEGTGSLDFQSRTLKNIDDPIEDTDAANKGYVDTAIGDIETALDNIITKYGLGGETV